MTVANLEKYRSLLAEAVSAYRVDSSYAEAIARQAGALRSRQESRRDRSAVDTERATD
jgi:hypothetical protein